MKNRVGKYLIKYSTGVVKMMGVIGIIEAIATARKDGANDPNLQLVEITDLGGCVIRWKPWTWVLMEWLRKVILNISSFLYLKLRRLIAVGQTFG